MFAYLIADFFSALLSRQASPVYYNLVVICYCVYMLVFGMTPLEVLIQPFGPFSPLGAQTVRFFDSA